MITEDYVSFETAKLLKEKGFNEKAKSYFTDDGLAGYMFGIGQKSNSELEDCFYCRPTLQMAMKWLRENHNIHITSVPNGIGENVFYMSIYRKYDYGWTHISDCLDEEYKEAEFHTPEEACEAAIKYCLENLI